MKKFSMHVKCESVHVRTILRREERKRNFTLSVKTIFSKQLI